MEPSPSPELACPNCGAVIPPASVRAYLGLARCPACGRVRGLTIPPPGRPANPSANHGVEFAWPRPLEMTDDGTRLTLTWPPLAHTSPGRLMVLILVGASTASQVAFSQLAPTGALSVVLLVTSLLFTALMLVGLICELFRRSSLTVSPAGVGLGSLPFLPIPGPTFRAARIGEVYVKPFTFPGPGTRYVVGVRLKGFGPHGLVLDLPTADDAEFLRRLFEDRLRPVDRPPAGPTSGKPG